MRSGVDDLNLPQLRPFCLIRCQGTDAVDLGRLSRRRHGEVAEQVNCACDGNLWSHGQTWRSESWEGKAGVSEGNRTWNLSDG